MENTENKPSPYLQLLKILGVFVLTWLIGSGLYFFSFKIFAFSSLNTLTSLFSLFLLSLALKINYQSPIFLFDIIFAIFYSFFYPFGQAILIILVLVLAQKVLKIV